MARVNVYENKTKVPQIYYDHNLNLITLKPGERYVESVSGIVDPEELRKQEDLSKLAADVDELKRVRKQLALIRVSKSIEDLDKFKEKERNEGVMAAIFVRQRELLKKETPDGGLFSNC